MTRLQEITLEAYNEGLRDGYRLAAYESLVNHEPRLKLEVRLAGTSVPSRRAHALGELRGYRQARDD